MPLARPKTGGRAALAALLPLVLAGQAAAQSGPDADRPVSIAERLSTAGRVLPLALTTESLAADVAERARRHFRDRTGRTGRVSVWLGPEGRTLDFDDPGFGGRMLGGAGGIEYGIAEDWLVGFRLGFDDARVDTGLGGRDGQLDARTVSLGVYGAWQPFGNWVIDGYAGAGRASYEFENAGVTGEIDGDRFQAALGASALYEVGPVRVTPRLALALAVDSTVDFVDSAGIEATNTLTTYLEGSAGGEVSYPVRLGLFALEPFAAAAVVGTLDEVGSASLVGDTVHARLGAGVRVFHGPLDLVLEGRAAGFGSRDFNDYQGLLRLGYAF